MCRKPTLAVLVIASMLGTALAHAGEDPLSDEQRRRRFTEAMAAAERAALAIQKKEWKELATRILSEYWAEADLGRSLEYLKSFKSDFSRYDAACVFGRTYVRHYAKDGLDEARRAIEQIQDRAIYKRCLEGLSEVWAGKNPQAALEWVQKLQPGIEKDWCQFNVAKAFIASDPQQALRIVAGNPQRDFTDWVIQATAVNYGATDLARGWETVKGIQDEIIRGHTYASIASDWARRDLPAIQKKISALPDGSPKTYARLAIYEFRAEFEPEKAAGEMESFKAADCYLFTAMHVAKIWAKSYPLEAIKWVCRHKEDDRNLIITYAIDGWAESNVEEAMRWLGAQGAWAAQMVMYSNMGLQIMRQQPQRFQVWVSSIPDPYARFLAFIGAASVFHPSPEVRAGGHPKGPLDGD